MSDKRSTWLGPSIGPPPKLPPPPPPPVAQELTIEQLAEFQRHWRLASVGPSAGPPPKLLPPPVSQELTIEQLGQILADNVHRLCVWSPPHTNWQAWPGVESVVVSGDLVQLNIETGSDDE
jgi:hypothetical protein